jgi:hypothetical protein
MISAALVAATSVVAQVHDPFSGDWAGACGDNAYCELQVQHLGPDTYAVDYVLERRFPQEEVCRVGGLFKRHRDPGDMRLIGGFGDQAVPAEIVRRETDTDIVLSVSGVIGRPCGYAISVNGGYRWFLDE